MPKARTTVPARTQKRVYQEANSRCPFCSEAEVAALEIHHIDGDPSNNAFENLILVCATCHSKISDGVLREAEVQSMKQELKSSIARTAALELGRAGVAVSILNSTFRGDIAHTITKISGGRAPRVKHPDGSIGADLPMKGYIDYLIHRYYNYRSADGTYRVQSSFSHAVIHQNIQRRFGHKTYFMPVALFSELVEYLQHCIDRTIQGKRNRAQGNRNYHSYEEHLQRHSPKV